MSNTPHHASNATDRDRARRLADVRGVRVRGGERGVGASRLHAAGSPRRRGAGVSPRMRGAGVAALVATAGLVLSACSGGEDPVALPSPASSSVTSSSSSSSPAPSTTPAPVDEPVPSVTAPAALSATHAPAPTANELPALVVDTGGPCHTIGEVAQALDGSPLFCLNDPDAGPLWLPQPEAGPDETTPALRGEPCAQEGLTLNASDGTAVTCTLTGDGSMPGGLLWQ